MPPLSGAEGVSFAGFLAFDTVGALLWTAGYVGIGYLFSSELELAIQWAKHFGTVMAIAVGVPLAFYVGWRGLVLARMIRRLRLRRITPSMLARKLKSNRKVALLDLLNFEDETAGESTGGIPGAFSVDPSKLRTSPQITIPDDVEVVLYCSSRRDMVSARVAIALKRIGLGKVWVLEGGLKAWHEQGFPVSKSLEAPELVAARLGVKLPKPQVQVTRP
jgi:rhodanese-related sulfurtransferase